MKRERRLRSCPNPPPHRLRAALQGNFFHDPTLALGQTRQQPSGVDRCGDVPIDRCLQGVGIVVDVDMVAESAPTQVIGQLMTGNRAKPRFERLCLVPGIALQMHGQQSLLHNILTIRRTSPRRCKAPSHDAPQPKRKHAREGVGTPRRPPALPIASLRRDRSNQPTRSVIHIFVLRRQNITRHLCRCRLGAVLKAARRAACVTDAADRSQLNAPRRGKKFFCRRNIEVIRHE